jgi:hypothetical protein
MKNAVKFIVRMFLFGVITYAVMQFAMALCFVSAYGLAQIGIGWATLLPGVTPAMFFMNCATAAAEAVAAGAIGFTSCKWLTDSWNPFALLD